MNEKLVPIEYKGQRVITTELLAQAYDTDANNIKVNFNRNKGKFKEGVHYFLLQGDDLRSFKREVTGSNLVAPNVNQLYLWTERGANRHCKILDTPKAWEQFDNLEETYFLVKEYAEREGTLPGKEKQAASEARLNYSRAKVSELWLKIADKVEIPEYRGICLHYASKALAGKEVIPLPVSTERYYTAAEVGEMLGGVSSHKIGSIANKHDLKTPEYGKMFLDKSPYSPKEVQAWRYNRKGVARLREILGK